MSARQIATRIVAGAATIMVTGSSLFALPGLSHFYTTAMTSTDGAVIARETPLWWSVGTGCLAYAALVHLVVGSRCRSMAAGAGGGALAGFLVWATADFMLFGISRMGTVTTTVIDPFLELIPGAVAGAVMMLVSAGVTRHSLVSVPEQANPAKGAAR